MGIKVANNAFGTLASSITNSATSITLTTGQGARFPTLSAGDYFYATLIDTSNNLEIVKCTARSTDVLTVTRAQENTTARAYSAGDRIEIRITAATFEEATAIADGEVTAAKLASGAAVSNIGYTPLGDRGAANSIADWNDLTALGSYRTAPDGADANAPGSANLYGNLMSFGSDNGRSQVFVNHSDAAELYFRTKWNASDWKPWARALTRDHVVIGASTDGWHDLESTVLASGDNVIRRRAKHFTNQGTTNIFTTLINYGWAGYFFRVHLFEFGYLGTGYRSATFSQHGSGTNIVSGGYSPWWRYEMNNSPCHSTLNFTGSGPTGGGVDVGYYTVNAQVNVATYTSALILVEFDQGRTVSGSNPPPKNGIYFY